MKKVDKILFIFFLILAIGLVVGGFVVAKVSFSAGNFQYNEGLLINDPYDPRSSVKDLQKMAPFFQKNIVYSQKFWANDQINGEKLDPFINKNK